MLLHVFTICACMWAVAHGQTPCPVGKPAIMNEVGSLVICGSEIHVEYEGVRYNIVDLITELESINTFLEDRISQLENIGPAPTPTPSPSPSPSPSGFYTCSPTPACRFTGHPATEAVVVGEDPPYYYTVFNFTMTVNTTSQISVVSEDFTNGIRISINTPSYTLTDINENQLYHFNHLQLPAFVSLNSGVLYYIIIYGEVASVGHGTYFEVTLFGNFP